MKIRLNYFWIAMAILALGLIYRLVLTSQGNWLFNMDNARDWVDIREMVQLHKIRLIGPTTGIEGVFTGPGWYYLLVLPYILSQGNPYSGVLLMIGLWLIGGGFLLQILRSRGGLAMVIGSILWSTSPYLVLATSYSYNPNPVELLTPVLIYWLWQYLKTGGRWYGWGCWLLAGLFLNFEMAAGLAVPPIIIVSILIAKRGKYLKTVDFWLGVGLMLGCLVPQLIFELKHHWFMTNSLLNHIYGPSDGSPTGWSRQMMVLRVYNEVISGNLYNNQWLVGLWLVIVVVGGGWLIRRRRQIDLLVEVIIVTLLVPMLVHLILPIQVMIWHLGLWVGGMILLISDFYGQFSQRSILIKSSLLGLAIIMTVVGISTLNIGTLINRQQSQDPSVYANEIQAIDAVYRLANGQRFRVYSYLPSVIDYPYQYLIWWYGGKRYGYLPDDYAYAPNKPAYISEKELILPLPGVKRLAEGSDSGLIYLIEEPDNGRRREYWENNFKSTVSLRQDQVGPLLIQSRQENHQ